jgi:aspartyl-tRNA(Asn)/glutamyl-tRNA(Gln) amidotransferase subunit A
MAEPLTITDASPLIRTGELTPSELLEQCLRRIDLYEPAVKAWMYLDRERARQDAARATDEIKSKNYRGSLHGIPVGIKDIIDVFDMPTGCGSKLWANSYARRDATCVERLRQAGAVILGKTVTTPYAFTDPPVTRNPWNLARTPGGSSCGSAAAVACGMCLAALGTQTGGSLTRPASYCGVCSLKPTWGRVSVDGVLPLAPSLDHVGIIAGCVRDLAVVFQVIAGEDHRDSGSSKEAVPDFSWSFPEPPDPITFGRIGGMFRDRADPITTAFLTNTLERQIKFGGLAATNSGCIGINEVRMADVRLPTGFGTVTLMHKRMMAAEAAAVHGERLARHPDDYPPRITELCEFGERTTAAELAEAQQHQDNLQRETARLFDYVSALICPAATGVAPTTETTGEPVLNSPWSYLGLPTVSVPFGVSPDGLPLAVQLVARRCDEAELIAMACKVENWNTCPRRLPPVPAGVG